MTKCAGYKPGERRSTFLLFGWCWWFGFWPCHYETKEQNNFPEEGNKTEIEEGQGDPPHTFFPKKIWHTN